MWTVDDNTLESPKSVSFTIVTLLLVAIRTFAG